MIITSKAKQMNSLLEFDLYGYVAHNVSPWLTLIYIPFQLNGFSHFLEVFLKEMTPKRRTFWWGIVRLVQWKEQKSKAAKSLSLGCEKQWSISDDNDIDDSNNSVIKDIHHNWGWVPKTTLQLASNPTPVGWNHPHGQQYPQPSHKPLHQQNPHGHHSHWKTFSGSQTK